MNCTIFEQKAFVMSLVGWSGWNIKKGPPIAIIQNWTLKNKKCYLIVSQKSYVPHICSQVCIELISYEITVFRPKTAKFRVKYLLGNLANYQDLTSIKQTQFSWFLTCQNNLWTNQKDFFFSIWFCRTYSDWQHRLFWPQKCQTSKFAAPCSVLWFEYVGYKSEFYEFLSSPIACVACERTELLKTEIHVLLLLHLSFFRILKLFVLLWYLWYVYLWYVYLWYVYLWYVYLW